MYICAPTTLDSLDLGLQMAVSHHMNAETQTLFFCKSKCSSLQSHLSSPETANFKEFPKSKLLEFSQHWFSGSLCLRLFPSQALSLRHPCSVPASTDSSSTQEQNVPKSSSGLCSCQLCANG